MGKAEKIIVGLIVGILLSGIIATAAIWGVRSLEEKETRYVDLLNVFYRFTEPGERSTSQARSVSWDYSVTYSAGMLHEYTETGDCVNTQGETIELEVTAYAIELEIYAEGAEESGAALRIENEEESVVWSRFLSEGETVEASVELAPGVYEIKTTGAVRIYCFGFDRSDR